MIRRTPNDKFQDKALFPWKATLPIKFFIGAGVILATFLPTVYARILGIAMIGSTVLKSILARLNLYKDPLTKLVLPGRKHAEIEGDYVVFLIGARANKSVDGYFKWIGDAFGEMIEELESDPSLGYLGSEGFVGATGTISVQYWKTAKELNAWASSSMKHSPVWKKMMQKGKECSDYGFWHETHEVKAGRYETVYVNMPPMMLGNCRNVKLADIMSSHRYNSAAGRMGGDKKEH